MPPSSAGSAFARLAGSGYRRNKLGRHQVDPGIGALGREDRRHQELIRVAMDKGTDGVRINFLERIRHPRAWVGGLLAFFMDLDIDLLSSVKSSSPGVSSSRTIPVARLVDALMNLQCDESGPTVARPSG